MILQEEEYVLKRDDGEVWWKLLFGMQDLKCFRLTVVETPYDVLVSGLAIQDREICNGVTEYGEIVEAMGVLKE